MLYFFCLSIKRIHDLMMKMKTNNNIGDRRWTLGHIGDRKKRHKKIIIKIKANETSFYILLSSLWQKVTRHKKKERLKRIDGDACPVLSWNCVEMTSLHLITQKTENQLTLKRLTFISKSCNRKTKQKNVENVPLITIHHPS